MKVILWWKWELSKKWKGVMACYVSPVTMFLDRRRIFSEVGWVLSGVGCLTHLVPSSNLVKHSHRSNTINEKKIKSERWPNVYSDMRPIDATNNHLLHKCIALFHNRLSNVCLSKIEAVKKGAASPNEPKFLLHRRRRKKLCRYALLWNTLWKITF